MANLLGWVIFFLISSVVLGFLGFWVLGGFVGLVAKVLFFVSVVLLAIWAIRWLMGLGHHTHVHRHRHW